MSAPAELLLELASVVGMAELAVVAEPEHRARLLRRIEAVIADAIAALLEGTR